MYYTILYITFGWKVNNNSQFKIWRILDSKELQWLKQLNFDSKSNQKALHQGLENWGSIFLLIGVWLLAFSSIRIGLNNGFYRPKFLVLGL